MGRHSRRYHYHVEPVAPAAPVPATCLWNFGGWPYRLTVWSESQWRRLAPEERPPRARRLEGLGWATLCFDNLTTEADRASPG
jgi:hypothetical protein